MGRFWSEFEMICPGACTRSALEHFLFENALLTRKRQPPQRGVHSGENRVFRLNATFDFHKKSKVICSSKRSRPRANLRQAAQAMFAAHHDWHTTG
ncbi:hypothetical protein [Desulfovibrio sp. ZJ200]|uniref:hypothetical protein n=1 Tax=Desulfovibrio sp. ZJ200 TaxID=2709792 RepID=UPI0013EA7DFA|nr:hypothetical protein [Desulfovibrio sp. ZJ200]